MTLPAAHAQTTLAETAALRERVAAHARAGETEQQAAALARLLALERSPRALNDLGLFLSDQGDFGRAQDLLAEAVAAAPADQRGLYQANQALNLRRQFRDAEAEALLQQALQQIDAYNGPLTGWRRCNLSRSRAVALLQSSRIAERRGQLERALELAQAAQAAARSAVDQVPPGARADEQRLVAADLANALRREVYVHINAQRAVPAEQALARWQAWAGAQSLGTPVLAQVQAAGAALAMARQRFDEADSAARAADALYEQQQLAPHHLARVTLLETRLAALWARQQAAQALPLLERVDRSAAGQLAQQPGLQAVVQMPLVRGLVYLDSGRAADAVPLFDAQRQRMAASAGENSLPHAEATGLLGAALWAQADPAGRARAGAWLTQAVQVLSAPLNAGAPDGSGLRALIRRRVVDAWVASQVEGSGPPPAGAVTLLDWSGNSPVQLAVTQAAVRMAIRDPAMRELVRSEQDLRLAIESLGRGGGDDGRAAAPPSAAVAAAQAGRLQALQAELAAVTLRIRERFPDYASLTQPALPTPEAMTRALNPGEALLVVATRAQDTLVWLIRADQRITGHRAELPLARLQALVSRLRTSLEFPDQGNLPPFDREASGTLHRLLVQPLLADLAGVSHLTVVTQGPLAALPMAVLAPADGRPDRDADWLLRRTALSQAPSLQAWLATRSLPARGDTPLTMLGWGDPQFGRAVDTAAATRKQAAKSVRSAAPFVTVRAATSRDAPDPGEAFPSLPETREELMAIAQALGADPERQLFLGQRATRDSILEASRSGRLAQSRVVAFATHGLKAGQWPGLEQPALVMAIPPTVPGPEATSHMLRLDDALSLKLDADWVVLSACNTTAGDHEAGEALSGLARGMFYAGARSLLATHWAVETRSATQIVTDTFRAYAGSARPGKAEALRGAMLGVMARPGTSHPAYWAPYVVIGDGGR